MRLCGFRDIARLLPVAIGFIVLVLLAVYMSCRFTESLRWDLDVESIFQWPGNRKMSSNLSISSRLKM
jgi:hypothetical protein